MYFGLCFSTGVIDSPQFCGTTVSTRSSLTPALIQVRHRQPRRDRRRLADKIYFRTSATSTTSSTFRRRRFGSGRARVRLLSRHRRLPPISLRFDVRPDPNQPYFINVLSIFCASYISMFASHMWLFGGVFSDTPNN